MHNSLSLDVTLPLYRQDRKVALNDRVAKHSQLRGFSGINYAALQSDRSNVMVNNVTKINFQDFPLLNRVFSPSSSYSVHPFLFYNIQYLNETMELARGIRSHLLRNTRDSYGLGVNLNILDTNVEALWLMGVRRQKDKEYDDNGSLLSWMVNVWS